MRTVKMLLAAVAITMSSAAYAGPNLKFVNEKSLVCEVEMLLEQQSNVLDKETEVVLFFSVSEDQKIQALSVASPKESVNVSVYRKLESSELPGSYWQKGKIYEIRISKKPALQLTHAKHSGFECPVKG